MTRAELQKRFTESVGRIVCLGPYVLDSVPPGEQGYHAKVAELRKRLIESDLLDSLAATSDKIASLFGLSARHDVTSVIERSLLVMYARTGCGYVWNGFLANQPFDGERREASCPQCGVILGWQHPISDEDAELKRLDQERQAHALLGEV